MKKNILVALLILLVTFPASFAEVAAKIECMDCMPYTPRIDVVFVIDSTGSMADEIRTVKTHLTQIIKDVEYGQPRPHLRVGVVAFRDHKTEENEYTYKKFQLTSNTGSALNFIRHIEARGGGDLPEAVADGLDVAINQMNWNDMTIDQNQEISPQLYPRTKKLIFLIGDAAPHGEGSSDQSFVQGCPKGHDYKQNIKDANKKGIRIYTISGSGIDSVGVRIFKEISGKTGGSYKHLNYVRRDVEEYYAEDGFTEEEVVEHATEAKEDSDYDATTNSILTNTLGVFTKSAMKAEAQEIGVTYGEDDTTNNDDWLDTNDITGGVIAETKDKEHLRESLYGFFKRIFDKISFWN